VRAKVPAAASTTHAHSTDMPHEIIALETPTQCLLLIAAAMTILWTLILAVSSPELTIVENLNQPVPIELTFLNQDGKQVQLLRYFTTGRPVVITPVYYGCPVLCSTVLKGVVSALRQTGLELGTDFDIVTYSIDPSETPAEAASKRKQLIEELGYPASTPAWDFLVGDEASTRALSKALGFQYRFDAQIKQYVHAAAFMLLTPDGHISRYVYGVRFPPRDVRLGLIEAAQGRIGTSFDRFILKCTRYDPLARKYQLYVWGVIRGGGSLVFLALAGMLVVLWRRERTR
jgi:protein SCO1/2